MNYFLDLFTPETAKAFGQSQRNVSGFRISRKAYIDHQKIGPGDKLICYVVRIQRFIGVLEITSAPYEDKKPIFAENDPFILRFNVKPVVWLPLEKAIPIRNDNIWNTLSFTKNLSKDSNKWTYMVFSSPRSWPKEDAAFLEKSLLNQNQQLIDFPFSEEDRKKLLTRKVKMPDSELTVTIPEEDAGTLGAEKIPEKEIRESIEIQAKLAEIGERMGLQIWLPQNDRARVLRLWQPKPGTLLEKFPVPLEEAFSRTIKNIDVIWFKGRVIKRAFEVEHTTAIYSGILRMSDLLALQPNLNIKIHIVAPAERKEDVLTQIGRPTFTVIGDPPLSERCTCILYDSVYEIAKEKNLEHMTDTIMDSYIAEPDE